MRVIKRGITLAVMSACVALLAVGGCTSTSSAPTEVAAHPEVGQAQPCSSCKASGHDFVHGTPYQGECRACHGLTSWTAVDYSHSNPDFDEGFHAVVGCPYCHTKARPDPEPSCTTCHQPSTHAVIPECKKCHVVQSWRTPRPTPKGHVSLINGHADLDCFACHLGSAAFAAPRTCVSCHGVHHGGLRACGSCHDPRYHWKAEPGFNHDRYFKLTGRHTKIRCTKCHPKYDFVATRPLCSSCHGVKHGGLTDCASCHRTSAFVPSTFTHSRVFRLVGAHRSLSCTACHPNRAFAHAIGSPDSCVSCHGRRHGGLSRCASCHTTSTFDPSTFNHSSRWKLTGAHTRVRCSKCHPKDRYAQVIGSPSRCRNCHGTKHGITTDCRSCHTTKAFSPSTVTQHPVPPALGGEHASRSCSLCHPSFNFGATPKPCADCHTAPHMTAGQGCLNCHRPTVWGAMTFSHPEIGYHTGLPITEACQYCHTSGTFTTYVCDQCHAPY